MLEVLASTVVAGAFSVVHAWRRNWLPAVAWGVITLAGTLNSCVMLANGNRMPVDRLHFVPEDGIHTSLTTRTRLPALADIYGQRAIRYSLGDVLLLPGAVLVFLDALSLWNSRAPNYFRRRT